MDDPQTINVPVYDGASLRIESPRIARYRHYDAYHRESSLQISSSWYDPLLGLFSATGLLPLPQNLAARVAEAMPKVRFDHGGLSYSEWVWQEAECRIRKNMDELGRGLKPEKYERMVENIFRKIFRPCDFTFEQKVKLFDHIVEHFIHQLEPDILEYFDNVYKQSHGISTTVDPDGLMNGWRGKKQLEETYLVNETRRLKEWGAWLPGVVTRKPVEMLVSSALDDWMEAQTAMRDLTGFDWSPLDFIFGDQLPTLVQIKTATLMAELKASYDCFMCDYRNFLEKINEVTRIGGALRDNALSFDSRLLAKYRVCIYISDKGRGLELAEDARDIAEIGKAFCGWLFGH